MSKPEDNKPAKYEGPSELETANGRSNLEAGIAGLAGAAAGAVGGALISKNRGSGALMGAAVVGGGAALAGSVHGYFAGREQAKRGREQFSDLATENAGLKAQVDGYRAAEQVRKETAAGADKAK